MDIKTIFLANETPRYSRVLSIDDQPVSHLTVVALNMRIDNSIVKIGGIQGVGTKKEERMKGYSAYLIKDTINFMEKNGFDASALFGISDFYNKFGYTVYMPEPHNTYAHVLTRNAEEAVPNANYSIRPATLEDTENIVELYNKNNTSQTASIVREKDSFKGFTKGSMWFLSVKSYVIETNKTFVGYFCVDARDDETRLTEIEATSVNVFPNIARILANIAIEKRCGEIKLFIPFHHPFCRYMQNFGMTSIAQTVRCGGSMMRIINQQSLLAKLANTFEKRIEGYYKTGTLIIKTELGKTKIRIAKSKISVTDTVSTPDLDIPQTDLTKMIMGQMLPSEAVKTEKSQLADTLFPIQNSYMYVNDMF